MRRKKTRKAFVWALLAAVLGALAVRRWDSRPQRRGLEGFLTPPLSAKLERIKSPPFTGPGAEALNLREKAEREMHDEKYRACAQTALQAYVHEDLARTLKASGRLEEAARDAFARTTRQVEAP